MCQLTRQYYIMMGIAKPYHLVSCIGKLQKKNQHSLRVKTIYSINANNKDVILKWWVHIGDILTFIKWKVCVCIIHCSQEPTQLQNYLLYNKWWINGIQKAMGNVVLFISQIYIYIANTNLNYFQFSLYAT